jgi:Ca2+:H+ antiporter
VTPILDGRELSTIGYFVSVLITGQVAADGETNWLQGVQLLATYLILAIVFYFLPEVADNLPLGK